MIVALDSGEVDFPPTEDWPTPWLVSDFLAVPDPKQLASGRSALPFNKRFVLVLELLANGMNPLWLARWLTVQRGVLANQGAVQHVANIFKEFRDSKLSQKTVLNWHRCIRVLVDGKMRWQDVKGGEPLKMAATSAPDEPYPQGRDEEPSEIWAEALAVLEAAKVGLPR